jgi:hypothetical protein
MAKAFEPAPKVPEGPARPVDPLAEAKAPAAEPALVPDSDAALRMEALEERLEQLTALLHSKSVNAADVLKSKDREAWYAEQAKEISKGNVVRTQEEAERRYPKGEHQFRCVLEDGNRHPPIVVRADNEVDAKGRYCDLCGVLSHEKPVTAVRV